jgi:hypothetical protein
LRFAKSGEFLKHNRTDYFPDRRFSVGAGAQSLILLEIWVRFAKSAADVM